MFDERQINILESIKVPNTYWDKRSLEYKYWFRSLIQKIDSALVFKGLPEGWSQDFFLLCLWCLGFVAVFKTERFGDPEHKIAFQPCTISGFDFYYQPKKCLVANPLYNKEFEIHKDAELIKLTPDFMGCWDIIDFYSQKLAEITKGIDVGLINAKMPLVMNATDESQSATLKKIYDKVQAGEPLVVWKDNELSFDEVFPTKDPFQVWNNDYKSTYLVTNLLEDMQTIMDQFYMEIGLPVRNFDGKAHMLNVEADMQNAQAQSRISCWVNTLKESLELVNKMFGTTISVEKFKEETDYERQDNSGWDGE